MYKNMKINNNKIKKVNILYQKLKISSQIENKNN